MKISCPSPAGWRNRGLRVWGAGLLASLSMAIFLFLIAPEFGAPKIDVVYLYGASQGLAPHTSTAQSASWALFILGGIVFATLYAVLYSRIPFCGVMKGLIYGSGVFLYASLVHLPILAKLSGADPGFLGTGLGGWAVPMTSFLAHLIYGGILGAIYAPQGIIGRIASSVRALNVSG